MGVGNRGALRIAFGVQILRVFQIWAIAPHAHMDAVADRNRVDLTGVDLAELRDLTLQALMCLVGRTGRIRARTEIETG